MNIKLLDKNYNVLGELDNFYSLIWHRKYFYVGEFRLTAIPDDVLLETKYLYRPDAAETGRVERIEATQNETGALQFVLCGRFLESFLNDRIIIPTYTTNTAKQVGEIIGDLITRNIVSPTDSTRKISNVRMGAVAQTEATEALQVTYDNLMEYIYELCLQVGCSVRAVYDFDTNQIEFRVWKGKDRTQDQEANSWAVFSDTFDNINQINYYKDQISYRNFAYIAGEGEGDERAIEQLNQMGGGEERHELYVDARDLQSKDENQTPIADVDYRKILIQRGREKLAEWPVIENIDSEVSPHNKSLVYQKDYDLGDICTIQYTALGITAEKRITECVETWEENALSISTVFGEDYLNFWNIAVHK